MPTEFSLFSALPTELREEIWNLAIRPKRSGVHIFRVYSTYMDHETSPEEVIHFSANEASFYGHERCELSLAVPLPHKSLDGANKDGARMTSSYMIDTGLWTACHESRSMMKKAFLTIKNTRHGKVPYYHLYNVDDALGHKALHVGIEYQSDWGPQFYDELQGDGECPAFDQIQGLQHNVFAPCIWLVDYNLKRKANALPHEGSLGHWEYIEPVPDGDYHKSSIYFAEMLHGSFVHAQKVGPEAMFHPTMGLLGWDNF
ncbi:hypothetical protein FOWG_10912 [Fusarium oxysporum f. sp. lycopersici MN25]|nr:hypothetical protein FOWG_10912 [Fusarium oxysporum f. sp. lycopersici MN25]